MNTSLLPQEQQVTEHQRQKIVLIDDDEDQLTVLRHRLGQQGFKTFSAVNGTNGLALVQRHKPHAVLMDLELPDSSGFDICQRITDDIDLCQIPVIIISGSENADVVRKTRMVGASFFIRKPYDPSALLLLVQKAIDDSAEYQ